MWIQVSQLQVCSKMLFYAFKLARYFIKTMRRCLRCHYNFISVVRMCSSCHCSSSHALVSTCTMHFVVRSSTWRRSVVVVMVCARTMHGARRRSAVVAMVCACTMHVVRTCSTWRGSAVLVVC